MENDKITITLPSDDMPSMGSSYTVTSDTIDTITLSSNSSWISTTGFNPSTITFDDFWQFPKTTPFIDGFPEWGDFEKMRNEYPSVEKAFENLRTVYKLCEAEWEGKKREEDGNI